MEFFKPDTEFSETLLDKYSDEQVAYYANRSPTLTTTRTESVRVLSDHLVVKSVPWPEDHCDETDAMDKARSVSVKVPTVCRVVSLSEGDYLIVMERIHGKTLEQLWPSLGLWATIHIAWQLRSFVSALRTVTLQKTGGVHSGRVRSEWIQGINGPVPYASPSLFCDYLNWWLVKARPRLCLVDWGRSGFYPAFMEYLGMEGPERAMPWLAARSLASWWGGYRWSLLCLIACGYSRLHSKGRAVCVVVQQRSLRYRLEKP
ncbi:kinase-like protein, partial [Pisolithus microcarpus]